MIFNSLGKKLVMLSVLASPAVSFGQGIPMERFCDIYGDTAPQRIEKIVRIFRLRYRTAEEMNGDITCPEGEVFKLTSPCIGLYRIAIFSLSNDKTQRHLSAATKLIHLYKSKNGEEELLRCQELAEE